MIEIFGNGVVTTEVHEGIDHPGNPVLAVSIQKDHAVSGDVDHDEGCGGRRQQHSNLYRRSVIDHPEGNYGAFTKSGRSLIGQGYDNLSHLNA